MKVRAEIRSGHSLRANHPLPNIASEPQKSIKLKLLVFFFKLSKGRQIIVKKKS